MKIIIADEERLDEILHHHYDEHIGTILKSDGLNLGNLEETITEYFSRKPEILPEIYVESENITFVLENWIQMFWRNIVRFFANQYLNEYYAEAFTDDEIQSLTEYTTRVISHPSEFEEKLIQYLTFFDFMKKQEKD